MSQSPAMREWECWATTNDDFPETLPELRTSRYWAEESLTALGRPLQGRRLLRVHIIELPAESADA